MRARGPDAPAPATPALTSAGPRPWPPAPRGRRYRCASRRTHPREPAPSHREPCASRGRAGGR
nr:hypothetical protein JVH1_6502 [Rhodococcus sp. JVH1]